MSCVRVTRLSDLVWTTILQVAFSLSTLISHYDWGNALNAPAFTLAIPALKIFEYFIIVYVAFVLYL